MVVASAERRDAAASRAANCLRPRDEPTFRTTEDQQREQTLTSLDTWQYIHKCDEGIQLACGGWAAKATSTQSIDKGHDSFLLDVPDFLETLRGFLDSSYERLNEKGI